MRVISVASVFISIVERQAAIARAIAVFVASSAAIRCATRLEQSGYGGGQPCIFDVPSSPLLEMVACRPVKP